VHPKRCLFCVPACAEDVWKRVQVKGKVVSIPRVAPKFIKFLRARRSVYREIAAMAALEHHDNVLDLYEVLELVEDSKATLFLVLEMATGGELFDRYPHPPPPPSPFVDSKPFTMLGILPRRTCAFPRGLVVYLLPRMCACILLQDQD
jgi:serine/threonine protein kinase